MWKLTIFLLFCAISMVLGALPACSSAGCPSGGIWSEWAVTGDPECSMSCGSCASLYYTRKCASERVGCNCTGSPSKYVPCNTSPCVYPSQKSCCSPYLSMVISGKYICGPIPVDKSTSGQVSCCPPGGLLTQWTTWARNKADTSWYRTRECVTSDVDCPCTGSALSETQTQCPCPATMNDYRNASCDVAGKHVAAYFPVFAVNDNTCSATATMAADNYINLNNADTYLYCADDAKHQYGIPYFVLQVDRTETTDAPDCPFDQPFACYQTIVGTLNHLWRTVTFTCDLEKAKWRYDYNGYYVTGYNQHRIFK